MSAVFVSPDLPTESPPPPPPPHKTHRFRAISLISLAVVGLTIAAAPAAATTPTSGTGGPFTDRTNVSYTATNGLTSQYHIYAAGLSQTSALCVVFHFHGDGAYEFKHPNDSYLLGGPNGVIAKSRAHGCLTIPVMTPDRRNGTTWWVNGKANAAYFRDLLGYIERSYNIDENRIWLSGYSGGSQFITKFYLPLYPSTIHGGGSVVFGGGSRPSSAQPFGTLPSKFHMHWNTNKGDTGFDDDGFNAYKAAQQGEAYYKSKGFATSHVYPNERGHDYNGTFGGVVAQQLDLYDKPLSRNG